MERAVADYQRVLELSDSRGVQRLVEERLAALAAVTP
jgi:hypothetical protein